MSDDERPRDAARPIEWVPIATYAREYEAEIGRAVLQAGGFDARVEGGERIAIFGPGFESVYPVLLIMMLVPAIGILTFPLPSMLLALDRASAPLVARLVGTVTYLLLIYPLATQFGLTGAAWAFVIGNILMAATLIAQLRGEHSRVRRK